MCVISCCIPLEYRMFTQTISRVLYIKFIERLWSNVIRTDCTVITAWLVFDVSFRVVSLNGSKLSR